MMFEKKTSALMWTATSASWKLHDVLLLAPRLLGSRSGLNSGQGMGLIRLFLYDPPMWVTTEKVRFGNGRESRGDSARTNASSTHGRSGAAMLLPLGQAAGWKILEAMETGGSDDRAVSKIVR